MEKSFFDMPDKLQIEVLSKVSLFPLISLMEWLFLSFVIITAAENVFAFGGQAGREKCKQTPTTDALIISLKRIFSFNFLFFNNLIFLLYSL